MDNQSNQETENYISQFPKSFIFIYLAVKIPSSLLIGKTFLPIALFAILQSAPEIMALILFFLGKKKEALVTLDLGSFFGLLFLASNFFLADPTTEDHICNVERYNKNTPVCNYNGISKNIPLDSTVTNAKSLKITVSKGFWGYDILKSATVDETE